jgi:adenosylcobinamide-phosphate synthase
MSYELALLAYFIDLRFGEFAIKHPVVYMGEYIKWFESRYYKDSIANGVVLAITLIVIVATVAIGIEYLCSMLGFFEVVVLSVIASTTIASNMLYSSVKDVILSDSPKEAISMLVSRDTKDISESDINKASIETYAENLSDGVIAPLFYLILFGLKGALVYKAINTLDSMVGYRNDKYERYGKFSARLDDIINYIPAKITTLLIVVLFASKEAIYALKDANKHDSPNAGYPIAAMAGAIGVSLGGPTSYFGKIKQKPYFGIGRKNITKDDVIKALSIKKRLDIFIIVSLLIGVII